MDTDEIIKNSKASITQQELRYIIDKVGKINPKIILEVGIDRGYSLEVWQKAFNPVKLIGIDTEHKIPEDLQDELNAEIIIGDSHHLRAFEAVTDKLDRQQIDFLFIDGDHTEYGVEADVIMYTPFVRKGGIIVLHDACVMNNETVEVFRYVPKFTKKFKKVSSFKSNGTGLVLARV